MEITFDPAKRDRTLADRGLDFADAGEIFSGRKFEFVDDRRNYGEERTITVGFLDGRMIVVVWTKRGDARRIISMRKANDREKTLFGQQLGES